MRHRLGLKLLGCGFLLLAAIGVSEAAYYDRPRELDVTGPYTQEGSGMVFPEEVAGFERMGVVSYNSERTDESVNYLLESGGTQVVVTVYVYPVPLNLGAALAQALSPQDVANQTTILGEQFFAEEEQIVLEYHQGAEVLDEKRTFFDQRGTSYPGFAAAFRYEEDFFGSVQTVVSELHLYPMVAKNWMVKYRVTYPDGFNGAPEAQKFIDALPWTLKDLQPATRP